MAVDDRGDPITTSLTICRTLAPLWVDPAREMARGPWAAKWNSITRWARAIHAPPEALPWRSQSVGVLP